MKKLYLIRHAKSSWSDISLSDFDRPLNKRGKLNAPLMGDRLKSRGVVPDLILSSPAKRAKKTAKIIAKTVKYSKDILFEDEMYDASVNTLHNLLSKIDDTINVVFLIGHNPELNMLAEKYVDFYENIPTCGIVEIEFNSDKWIGVDEDNAKFISFDYPKKGL